MHARSVFRRDPGWGVPCYVIGMISDTRTGESYSDETIIYHC